MKITELEWKTILLASAKWSHWEVEPIEKLNANLHQAETIKTRLEQQMDNLDVTDIHYDKKISDLQRRLDIQYDKIDEVEAGNWIRNIQFQFLVPILRDGKEVVRVD